MNGFIAEFWRSIRKDSNRKLKLGAEMLAIGVLYGIYLLFFRNRVVLLVFQDRDFARASQILQGNQIFFGPELTGGGTLPGSLYYYFLALRQGLWGSYFQHLILQVYALAALWLFFRAYVGFLSAAFALLAYASAYAALFGTVFLLNSGGAFVFAALIGSGLSFGDEDTKERDRFRNLCAIILLFALGVQFHLTILALLPVFLGLQFFAPSFGKVRLPWKKFFQSTLFLFPLLPFVIWKIAGSLGWHFGQQPPRFAEAEGFGNFFKFAYNAPVFLKWQLDAQGGFFSALGNLLLDLHRYVFDLGGLTYFAYGIILAWVGNFISRRQKKKNKKLDQIDRFTLIWLACAVCAFVPALLGTGGTGFLVRYNGCFTVAYIGFVACALASLLKQFAPAYAGESKKWVKAALLLLGPAYIFFFGALSSRFDQRMESEAAFANLVPAADLERLSLEVVKQTDWDYATFRERAFYVNIFNELNAQTVYEDALTKMAARVSLGADPDGYFVARTKDSKEQENALFDPSPWLLQQRLPANLQDGLRKKKILVGEAKDFGRRLLLIPYFVKDKNAYPAYFQNRSEHYENFQEENINNALDEEKRGKARVALFQHCPDPLCRFALVARSKNFGDAKEPLHLEILGQPLSQPSNLISAGWTEAVFEPYVRYRCAGSKEWKKETLAPAVGFYVLDSWILNHSFLAPYRREIRSGCAITELRLGFGSSSALSHLRSASFAGEEKSFPLR